MAASAYRGRLVSIPRFETIQPRNGSKDPWTVGGSLLLIKVNIFKVVDRRPRAVYWDYCVGVVECREKRSLKTVYTHIYIPWVYSSCQIPRVHMYLPR